MSDVHPRPVERRTHGRLYALFSGGEGALKRKGPYARLRFEATIVRERSGGPEIAHHSGLEWYVDGESFARLDVEEGIVLHFVDGKTSNPYSAEHFSVVNGICFCDGQVCAYLDPSRNAWVLQADGRSWPVMLVEPVAPRPTRAAARSPDRETRRSRTHR